MLKRLSLSASFLALVLSVAACGGDDGTAKSGEAASATDATTAATEADEATPEQMASIIAGQLSDWREVIDGAADCRFLWTIGGDGSFADEAEAVSCYTREVTMGISAGNAVKELASLAEPASMTALVQETSDALNGVAAVELESVCGEAFDVPKDTKDCSTALGMRNNGYRALETALDKWSPYL